MDPAVPQVNTAVAQPVDNDRILRRVQRLVQYREILEKQDRISKLMKQVVGLVDLGYPKSAVIQKLLLALEYLREVTAMKVSSYLRLLCLIRNIYVLTVQTPK